MIFFQFAGQQKMFTNNRLEDKKPAALQWVKIYSQVHVSVKLNLFSGSKIKTKRNPIFYPFIFLNLLFDIALALRDFYHWEHRNFYFYPFQLHTLWICKICLTHTSYLNAFPVFSFVKCISIPHLKPFVSLPQSVCQANTCLLENNSFSEGKTSTKHMYNLLQSQTRK